MKHNIIWGAVVLILILFVLSLCSCYTPRKAKGDFGKAVTAYPEIGATFCAITYPAKDSLIKGDSIVTYDTLWGEGEIHFDTIYSRSKDTVYITKFIHGNIIRETIRTTDTVRVVDMAALTSCRLEQGKIVDLLTDKTAEVSALRKLAKKRFWVIAGMGAAIGLWLFLFIRRKIKA